VNLQLQNNMELGLLCIIYVSAFGSRFSGKAESHVALNLEKIQPEVSPI
jgi:hypothetical protein